MAADDHAVSAPAPSSRYPQLEPELRKSRKSKAKSPNAVRSRPADAMLMTSMIDSLSALNAPVSGDMRRYHQTVEGDTHNFESSAWYTSQGRVPSPSRRISSRYAVQSQGSSRRPTVVDTPRHASVGATQQDRPPRLDSNGDRAEGFFPASASQMTVSQSRSSQRTTRSRKSRRRLTHEISAFGPSQSTERADPVTPVSFSAPALSPSLQWTGSSQADIAPGYDLQTPPGDQQYRVMAHRPFEEANQSVNAVNGDSRVPSNAVDGTISRWKGKGVANDEVPSPLANMIPMRRSSLHHASRSMSRKSIRRTKSSENTASHSPDNKRDDVLTEEVLADLGDEDETVKRIRQLKEQRLQRMRSIDIEKSLAPENTDDSNDHVLRSWSESAASQDPTQRMASRSPQPTPLSSSPGSRVPDNAKASKILGLHAAPASPKDSGISSFASRLETPFDPYSEYVAYGKPRSPSPERSLSHPVNDYARYLQKTGNDLRAQRATARTPEPEAPTQPTKRRSVSTSRRSTAAQSRPRPSTDDDTEAYITSPRLNRLIRHPQTNRVISYSEVGSPRGHPVIVCVGMGLTRFVSAFYDDLALSLNLRLITPDRPGVSATDPLPRPSDGPLAWPDDVRAICAHLDLTRVGLLAHSAGTIYALATALRCPDLVVGRIVLLAPWIPPSQLDALLPLSQRFLKALPVPLIKVATSTFAPRPEEAGEVELPSSPAVGGRARRIYAASTAGANPAADLLVCLERHAPIGFRFADVGGEVLILHGGEDKRVRVENVRWLVGRWNAVRKARREREVQLRVLEGEGHGLMSSASVMADVLAQLAEGLV